MRFQSILRLFCFITMLLAFNAIAATASPTIAIDDFKDKSGQPASEFKEFLIKALTDAGFSCSNSSDVKNDVRYTLAGIVKKNKKGTSYSALLTDRFSLEPEVFFNGKQIGGTNTAPAASKLSKSVEKLLSNQIITSVEIFGDSRLTPNAIMALAQIRPGETASPEKLIAGRIILENCGLFENAQLYITPGPEGRKLKITVKEGVMVIANSMPGPGKAVLDNILGPPVNDLPKFPELPEALAQKICSTSSIGFIAHEAEKALAKFELSDSKYTPEDLEYLICVASAIRNKIYSYNRSCNNMCIILLKLCSVLDSKTVRNITTQLQRELPLTTSESNTMEKTLERIEFINQSYSAAAETQTSLASRLYTESPHAPTIPWVLFSLGEQALKAEDIKRSAPLLKAAISVSSLPVSPEMLILTAQTQYSNLDRSSGDTASALLRPLLAEPNLNLFIQKQIKMMPHWAALCETVIAITDDDDFRLQLKKGDALILLDRPDLAEPLFHRLHEERPDDARPFTGFGRLAFQRTGNLYSARPYIERGSKLKQRDRFFYELALAYTLKRIAGEALPTIRIKGRHSEEAAATRFLLPKATLYAEGYEQFNKAQALLIKSGITVLDEWLSYTTMENDAACENMFMQTDLLKNELPDSEEILSANYFFSTFSTDRDSIRKMLILPLVNSIGLKPRIAQLNLLIREMAISPTKELAEATEAAVVSIATDAENRSRVVALQADALAIVGLYMNSEENLIRAKSLYDLAIDLSNSPEKGRLLNNQACVYLTLGKKSEADDLYDEAMDNSPDFPEAVTLGKTVSSFPQKELETELLAYIEKVETMELKQAAQEILGTKPEKTDENSVVNISSQSGSLHVLLKETSVTDSDYDNLEGLQLNFSYGSNPWLLPAKTKEKQQ
ncbi:cyclic nucleotide-binding protein [Maridesulfovibrio ferrireducens]|uniref:cyclic nucleotide-binding protein n=1 Tax=Maridesulfovibrio ferrireducens TaxID=246191 RepID=UPI001A1F7471|nr:cyclic nucleotide-binding protein [Maridesulfovibrio ferrireducens]MBI9111976.1 tetratricopeptide repeat protein [Maridesulfovibrio ferrireducens]